MMHKLYAIDVYAKNDEFIKNGYKEYNLKNLISKLKNDKGYHMRICDDKNYIFFGDCDKFRGSYNEFIELLIDFLKNHYDINVSIDEISYTKNESVDGSFHYSIPKFYASCEKLKEIHEKFYQKHVDIFHYVIDKKNQKVVDTSIYGKKWFRYPQQHKAQNKDVKHIIIKGEMKDFVIEHIPEESICIDDKNYIISDDQNQENNKKVLVIKKKDKNNVKLGNLFMNATKNHQCTEAIYSDDVDMDCAIQEQEIGDNIDRTFKRKLLREILSGIKTYDDYNEWTNVGMALKNQSFNNNEFFDLWDNWSKNSTEKYNGTKMNQKKWNSFKKIPDGYSIHYLWGLLKKDDPEKYKKLQVRKDVQKFIENNKNHYPNNECSINEMNQRDQTYEITFVDKYCPICDDEHSDADDHRFFEITDRGTAGMKCTNEKCIGKICPMGGIPVPKNMTNLIFVVNNNNTNNYINNNVGTFEPIYNIRVVLDNINAKIFDDSVMNTHIIDSLSGYVTNIVNAVMYTNKEIVCFVDNEWYIFNGNLWIQRDDVVKNILLNFVPLYTKIKDFITESQELYGIEKNAYLDQIDKLVDSITNVSEKRNKEITLSLSSKLSQENKFDSNMNLMGFSNGVYDFEKMEFRKGKPFDMIKKSCGYDYVNDYENEQNMIQILLKIFPDKESMEFFLTFVVTSICGKNNSDLLFIIKWAKMRYCDTLMEILSSTFGDYCYRIDSLASIIPDENKVLTNLSYLKFARIVVVESMKSISENYIRKLIDTKQLKHRTENKVIETFGIQFSTLCMCTETPIVDNDLTKNTVIITSSNTKYTKCEYNKNDFFLLLLEYLEKFKEGKVTLDKEHIKVDERSEETKICEMFMKDCIKKSKGNEKTKDVYNRYIEWTNDKNFESQLTKRQLLLELKQAGLCHKKSIRFQDEYSPAFTQIILNHN